MTTQHDDSGLFRILFGPVAQKHYIGRHNITIIIILLCTPVLLSRRLRCTMIRQVHVVPSRRRRIGHKSHPSIARPAGVCRRGTSLTSASYTHHHPDLLITDGVICILYLFIFFFSLSIRHRVRVPSRIVYIIYMLDIHAQHT